MVMTFKQFLRWLDQQRWHVLRPSNTFVYRAGDPVAQRVAELLCEGGRSYELSHGYHCRFDRAHVPKQDDHLHVYNGQNQLCVINRDGTPSHGTSIELPRWVRRDIASLGLVSIDEQTHVLLEHYLAAEQQLLAELIAEAARLRTSSTG